MSDVIDTVPLCVDCDGTLIRTDLLHEACFRMLKRAPWRLLLLPWWALRGKAHLKDKLAQVTSFDWEVIPLREAVVARVREARAHGRRVVLVTASPSVWAQGLAAHLGCFDEVMASTASLNLAGAAKRDALVARFGVGGFDYIGDSRADLAVWTHAREAWVVAKSPRLLRAVRSIAPVCVVIESDFTGPMTYLRALRPHQWVKNVLIFVPVVAAHRNGWQDDLVAASVAFIAFSLAASAVYVLNDLLDLDADRTHSRKRFRPFASGNLALSRGALMLPILLGCALAVAAAVTTEFLALLLLYLVLTALYSFWLKRQVIVDVLLLAVLYTVRILAGSASTGIVPSFWLLAFSMFLFLSLAMVKRYCELRLSLAEQRPSLIGRGYHVSDLPVLVSIGIASGMVAVMVFALYINAPETSNVYSNSYVLWLVPLLLLYWISRIWMKANRGEIDQDPVLFAIRDWQSLVVVGISLMLFLLASGKYISLY